MLKNMKTMCRRKNGHGFPLQKHKERHLTSKAMRRAWGGSYLGAQCQPRALSGEQAAYPPCAEGFKSFNLAFGTFGGTDTPILVEELASTGAERQ